MFSLISIQTVEHTDSILRHFLKMFILIRRWQKKKMQSYPACKELKSGPGLLVYITFPWLS